MASKSGCEGDPAVGDRNVETMVIADRSDEGIAVERQRPHAQRCFHDRGRQGCGDEHPRSREKLPRTLIQMVISTWASRSSASREQSALACRAHIELRGVDDTIRLRCDALDRDHQPPARDPRVDDGQVVRV